MIKGISSGLFWY